MVKNKKLIVESTEISVSLSETTDNDYISLSDMAHFRDNKRTDYVIQNWLRNRNTIEYLGVWEQLNNPNFNSIEFYGIRNQSGINSFILTPKKWIESTNAVGVVTKAGRYGGTYAHKDIAFNFGMWLSPTFQLYVIKEYQRLKEEESNPLLGKWNVHRILTKANYTLQTDAIKSIIPQYNLSKYKEKIAYASEADMLNLIIFGCTAKDWEQMNPDLTKKGYNLRDTATINQLVVLSNIEARNSELLKQYGLEQRDRMTILHKIAKEQLAVLDTNNVEQKFRKLLGNDPKQLE